MARVDVNILGDQQLQKDLNTLASSSVNDIMRNPIRAGLQPIREAASQQYKAYGWDEFGAKRNLKRVVNSGKKGVVGSVVLADITSRKVTIEGREVPFNVVANILEFGSRKRNIREYRVMRDARDKNQQEALSIVHRKTTEQIEKKWKSGRLKFK